MKTVMKVGALAAVGCAILTGCASAPQIPEEDLKYLPQEWMDSTDAFVKANSEELRQPSKTGIPEVDFLCDQISEVYTESVNGALNTIAQVEAEKSWATYMQWINDESAQGATPAAKLTQAKFDTFPSALMFTTTDAVVTSKQMIELAKLVDTAGEKDPVTVSKDFVDANYPASKLVIAQTLANTVEFTDAGKAKYYKDAFQAKPMTKAERGSYLEVLIKRVATAVALQKSLKDAMNKESTKAKIAEYTKTIAMGMLADPESLKTAKEAMASIERIGKQLSASIELSKWEEEAIKNLDELNAKGGAN